MWAVRVALLVGVLSISACDAKQDPQQPRTLRDDLEDGGERVCADTEVQTQVLANIVRVLVEHDVPEIGQYWSEFQQRNLRIQFDAISRTGFDEKLLKVSCSGNVKLNGHTYGLEYTVSPNIGKNDANDVNVMTVTHDMTSDQRTELGIDLYNELARATGHPDADGQDAQQASDEAPQPPAETDMNATGDEVADPNNATMNTSGE